MEETQQAPAKKRKYTRKPQSGLVIRVGKKAHKADSYQITDRFLVIQKDRTSTYISLAECPTFLVIDNRERSVAAFLPAPSGTMTTAGGPVPAAADFALRRNRALESMMNEPLGG